MEFNSSECFFFIQYFVLLARFLRGQLQPPQQREMRKAFLFVGAPLSCSLKSLAKIRRIYM
ncbi:hypothetical protein [Staphylococcus lugdunensis]|uniref:hypothetical protein n=1 Tax=Staphylococcus lugdunensis TaxID=28035 RepID=UPI000CD024AF|nr:hypothetical protein A6J61_12155 [Staphylococcus lugdunensis]PNZ65076.1 hypothetical protein CD041_05260 [Staphylococcus lugdunensis]